ncbi:MAG: MATE family efflux transporter [Lachnospiraceae bacterium]|nr:MATE family efflux transporter [Lachnospiraceae bacterium]
MSETVKVDKNDLTQGPILKKLFLYFLPIAAGALFQQLYNAVDAIVVGRFVGTEALASVGGSPSILIQLLLGFFISLSGGCAVIIAQFFGAKDEKKVKTSVSTSLIFCLIIGAILTVVVCIFAPGVLKLLKTPADTLEGAIVYTRIYYAGCIFMLLFNMGSGILRAVGDSRKPFVYLMVSCAINIVLDLIFVIAFQWGVAGVAWATTIAQAISCILVILNLFRRKEYYRLNLKEFSFDLKILGKMLGIGIPSGVQSAMYGVSNMLLQIGVNSLGTIVVASWSMSGKIDGVYWSLINSFGVAVMNFVAQNYGAGKKERIRECTKTSLIYSLIGTAILSVIILFVAKPLLHIFTPDAAVIETTNKIIWYFVPTYVTWTVIEVLSGILRGKGDAVKPTAIVAGGVCVLRIIWIFTIFHFVPTLFVLSMAYPVSWVVTDVALLIYYFRSMRKEREKLQLEV